MTQPGLIVRKQIYDLRVGSTQAASGVHQLVERVHRQSVVELLAEIMREVGPPEELVLLERLELDLGKLNSDRMEEQLPERIEEVLRRKLDTQVLHSTSAASDHEGRTLDSPRTDVELLAAFLATGVLPWWAPAGTQVAERLARVLDDAPEEIVALLQRQRGERVAGRLARQFPADQVQRVIALLAGPGRAPIERVVRDWLSCVAGLAPLRHAGAEGRAAAVRAAAVAALCDGDSDPTALSQRVLAALHALETDAPGMELRLRAAAPHAVEADSPVLRFIERFVTATGRAQPEAAPGPQPGASSYPPPAVPGAGETDAASAELPEAALASAAARDEHDARERDSSTSAKVPRGRAPTDLRSDTGAEPLSGAASAKLEARSEVSFTAAVPEATAAVLEPTAAAPEPRAAAAMPDTPSLPDVTFDVVDGDVGLMVENAGLVLLWPFLSRFFAEAGLLEDGAFPSAAAAERAVLLLHLAATGQHETPEPSLVVNKLLCGFDLEEPVAGGFTPTERELREIGELHDSVLQAWSALGATSATGLQASFLQREGVLSRQELGWNLKVVRRGYDVLLDRLPWGIGLVMLPWMQEPLVVEW
jgi:hypothetical protein